VLPQHVEQLPKTIFHPNIRKNPNLKSNVTKVTIFVSKMSWTTYNSAAGRIFSKRFLQRASIE